MDAAWKGNVSCFAGRRNHAGIGVVIHDKTEGQKKNIIICAATQATSALQAEAKALELASWIAHILQIKKANFILDNQTSFWTQRCRSS